MKPRPKECLKLLLQKVLIYLLTQKVSMTSKLWEIKATTIKKMGAGLLARSAKCLPCEQEGLSLNPLWPCKNLGMAGSICSHRGGEQRQGDPQSILAKQPGPISELQLV